MNLSAGVFVFLLATASSVAAQSRAPLQAFPRSISPTLGIASFDTRSTNNGASFSYKGSLIVGAKLDQPLTRRTGLLFSAALAPLSQQRGQGSVSTVLADKLMVGIVDAALGFRFKPSAPVYFAAGGGLTYSTKPALPDATGAMSEPHALLGIGYDAQNDGGWNLRTSFTNRFVMVGDDGNAATVDESIAWDWTFELGLRYTFGSRSTR